MNTTKSSKAKSKSSPQKAKAKTVKPKKNSRSFQEVVGPEIYRTWVSMLHTLVPDGRTHRLAPLLAAMLQYALSVAEEKRGDDIDEDSIIQSLLDSAEASDPSEVKALLHNAVTLLFKDAHVEYRRTSSRGQQYSIAEDAYSEYIHWFNTPWD